MSPDSTAETIEREGCTILLRRVDGPAARELHYLGRPTGDAIEAGAQAAAIQRALVELLAVDGGSLDSVVSETLFLRNIAADLEAVRAARERASAGVEGAARRPARTEIEQPPLDASARLEIAGQAILPRSAPLVVESIGARPGCGCPPCVDAQGLRLDLGGESQLRVAGLCGAGEGAHDQVLDAFARAEDLLERAGMSFGDVLRTWIHLREIDRDYADLNRARRAFYSDRGIDPPPASTGIGGGPAPGPHRLCLGLLAVRSRDPLPRTVMHTPTLNEAVQYGADFVRGLAVEDANKRALHVSGTASIDEAGRTAHPGDLDAQVERMLRNVATLLEGQGAGFGDVVSAVTYLKRPADANRLRERLREAGFEGFPNALVVADVCRPELLCETEVLAVRPRRAASGRAPLALG